MTVRPCDNIISCECDDSPYRNISSEAPDPRTFFARRFVGAPNIIGNAVNTYRAPGCVNECTSEISQQEADWCALRQGTLCTIPPPGPNLPNPPPLFGNAATSCSAECPIGDPFVFSIPANTFLALSQELADQIAQSFCAQAAFENRVCSDITPPVPGTPCVSSVAVIPVGPLTKMTGDSVTFTGSFSYSGNPNNLAFVWFHDAVPIGMTPTAELTLTGLTGADSGTYALGIFASGCSPVFSNGVQLTVSNCPPEIGTAAPDTLDIVHTTDWETWDPIDAPDLTPIVSSNALCNPTFESYNTPANGRDHPPGVYGWKYVSGSLGVLDPFGCGVATPVSAGVGITQLVDEEHSWDFPVACNDLGLAHAARDLPGDPPPANNYGGGLSVCAADAADATAQLQAFWSGKAFTCDPYPPDNLLDFSHSNTGGQFSLNFPDITLTGETFFAPVVVMCTQLSGQIPQPRKVAIMDYLTLITQFGNIPAASAWDGTLPTRTTYTSSVLQWDAAASGAFGGATLEYITTHPSSTNGKGWKLSIYSAGAVLMAQYLKALDATSLGIYYLSSGVGPACLTCEDASVTTWYPGATPP